MPVADLTTCSSSSSSPCVRNRWCRYQRIDAKRIAVRAASDRSRSTTAAFSVSSRRQTGPLRIEPLAQTACIPQCVLGCVDQVERVPRSQAEAGGAEGQRTEHGLPRAPVAVADHHGSLWDRVHRLCAPRPSSPSSLRSAWPASGLAGGCARPGPRRHQTVPALCLRAAGQGAPLPCATASPQVPRTHAVTVSQRPNPADCRAEATVE